MSISTIQNFYKETITRAVTLTGATNIYVSALPTPDEGYVVISPSSSSLREIVYYTAKGTDSNGTYLTVTLANRGLGGTTAQTHAIGEPVRMNVTAEHIKEISDALDQIVAGGAQDASTIAKGISKLSVAPVSATNPIAVGDNDPRILDRPAEIKFGGTGADGALAITTGTTTIDLGGEAVVTKNYTSISITGDGKLAFSNPHNRGTIIILKSQGDVVLTSSTVPCIDVSSLGAASGYDGIGNLAFPRKGSVGTAIPDSAGVGGVGVDTYLPIADEVIGKVIPLYTGASGHNGVSGNYQGSGGGGSKTNGSSGGTYWSNVTGYPACSTNMSGGRGGGCLYVECAGDLNFTGTVWAKGGDTGKPGPDATCVAGGPGGGGGGRVVMLYNTATAFSGTITVTGGIGGTISWGMSGGNGGVGSSIVAANTEFN